VGAKRENAYQAKVIKRLNREFPGSTVMPNNGNYIQGFPDVTMFCGGRYALLECKRSENEPHQPNQDYYVDKFNRDSFAAFIFPENEEEVFRALHQFVGG